MSCTLQQAECGSAGGLRTSVQTHSSVFWCTWCASDHKMSNHGLFFFLSLNTDYEDLPCISRFGRFGCNCRTKEQHGEKWRRKVCNAWCSRRAVCQDEALCTRYFNTFPNSSCDPCWCFVQKPPFTNQVGDAFRSAVLQGKCLSSWGQSMEADQTLKSGLHQKILIFTYWKFIWRHFARGDSLWEDFFGIAFLNMKSASIHRYRVLVGAGL